VRLIREADVTPDDLNAPLGVGKSAGHRRAARFRLQAVALTMMSVLLGAVIALFALWSLFARDPLGGEPVVVVSAGIGNAATGSKADPAPSATASPGPPAATPADGDHLTKPPIPDVDQSSGDRAASTDQIITIIDGKSGARQEVRIPSGAEPSDSGLTEMTPSGPIPRIGPDGRRPWQAYARPFTRRPEMPQIAIVITGLGISASNTVEAINKLPGPVTLALAPYGQDIDRLAATARSLGHELLLQVPMEPFDYPDNDPGPQTLLVGLPVEQNLSRLQWTMSRFPAYVGIVNDMGARFTASELALLPIMREISKRGLIYVDDGSSPRSLANQFATGNNLAFVKANVVLDAVPSAAEIDAALVRLENVARETGNAVGVAAALPVVIARVSTWAKTAEGRGFALAPITAAAMRVKPS
jgi:uncharacterized protein